MGEGVHTIGKGVKKTDRSHLHDTDGGLNRQESFRVNQLESKIRNRKTEKGYLVGADGSIIAESVKNTKSSATFYVKDMVKAKDSVMTHNHPNDERSGLFGTMAGRIGVPFSDTDVKQAVKYNLKEVRAVTPTYTYSIRRPKGGWGDAKAISDALSAYRVRLITQIDRYVSSQRKGIDSRQRAYEVSDRANVGIQFSELKRLAKQFGWEFTRKRVK